jgi:hypothetical protein
VGAHRHAALRHRQLRDRLPHAGGRARPRDARGGAPRAPAGAARHSATDSRRDLRPPPRCAAVLRRPDAARESEHRRPVHRTERSRRHADRRLVVDRGPHAVPRVDPLAPGGARRPPAALGRGRARGVLLERAVRPRRDHLRLPDRHARQSHSRPPARSDARHLRDALRVGSGDEHDFLRRELGGRRLAHRAEPAPVPGVRRRSHRRCRSGVRCTRTISVRSTT